MEEVSGAGWTDNLFQVQTLCLAASIVYIDAAFYHWRLKHEDEAKDLKDLTIPFLRTRTIHAWLRDNDITDGNVWACLYKRELGYIFHVHSAAQYSNQQLEDLRSMIEEMLCGMNPEIIRDNRYITSEERNHFQDWSTQIVETWNKQTKLFKRKGKMSLLEHIFSLKNRGNHKVITICGIKIKINWKEIAKGVRP